VSEPNDKILDHEYDGIREYDNPLPGWWLALFWITIAFSAGYALYYHFGTGESVAARYDRQLLELYDVQSKELLKAGPVTDETLVGMAANDSMMSAARQVYATKCAPCHGELAQGKIGPNLTDAYWIHGGRPTEVYKTIMEGVPAKGMISWKTQLRPTEIMALAAYVGTLQGTSPPNPKAPQGKRLEPPEAAATGDAGN